MNQKTSKYKTEEALIISLLAKIISPKVTQAVVFVVNAYKQNTVAVGNERKKRKKIQMELLSTYVYVIIVGGGHRLPLFHMSKRFICINETKKY